MVNISQAVSCFHPLKAGRRQATSELPETVVRGFHPLKAGRRRLNRLNGDGQRQVSIPSRRVGDSCGSCESEEVARVSIPSRRVGDLVLLNFLTTVAIVSIPSRRVGDKVAKVKKLHECPVSIPSRRVGDQGKMKGKAGKRGQKGGRVAVDLR